MIDDDEDDDDEIVVGQDCPGHGDRGLQAAAGDGGGQAGNHA